MEKIQHLLNKAVANIKTYYQHVLSAALIILLVLIVYGQDLEILVNEALQSEALSHVLLIPFFAGFLFYLKKDLVKASLALEKLRKKTKTQYLDEVVGVTLCLIAFLLYWYGSHTFYVLQYHLFSLPIFIMGVTLILFNLKALTVMIFPILFLLFLTPPPTEFMYTIGGAMANFNTQASYTLLKTLRLPVTLSSSYGPPTIALTTSAEQSLSFTIDLPCSGIYSLIAFAMFAAFLAFVTSAPVLKKVWVFVLGFFMFEILNITRITMIVSVGYWFGEEAAMFMFHTVAGLLLVFIGMLLILFIAEKLLKIQILSTSQEQPTCPKCETSLRNFENFCLNCGKFLNQFHSRISHKFWAKLFLLLLGCSMVTLSIRAPTFAIAQGPIEVTSNSSWENATNVFPQISGYQLKFLYRDENYEKIAHQDASLMYAYFPTNKSNAIVYVDVGVANSISNLHSWEVCLVAWQTAQGQYPLVSVLDSKDTQLLEDVPLIARYLVFESPQNYTQITLYWYEKATFHIGITVEQKYVRISLIILTQNPTNYKQFEHELLTFGQQIASYWEPLKNQSLVSLGVPAQQLLLALSIAFVIFTKTAQYSSEWRKKINNLKIFNNFAPAEEKLVLKTILDLAKEKKAMETREINAAIKRKTRKPLKFNKLQNTLNSLEKYGFIEKNIATVRNRPRLIWKTKY
ncbi:MAG: exosortase/archaeosortase family protein [Thermoproteota archaeon]|nr:exosortase/archaeosortase family protein [Thermoproteota archaeon]